MPKFIEIMFILVGAMLVTTHVMADTSAVGSDGITYRVPPKLYGEVYLQNGETRITKEENCNFKKTSLFLQKKICSDSEKVMRKGDDITMESTGPSETLVYRFDVIGVVAGMTFMAIAIVLFRLLKKLRLNLRNQLSPLFLLHRISMQTTTVSTMMRTTVLMSQMTIRLTPMKTVLAMLGKNQQMVKERWQV